MTTRFNNAINALVQAFFTDTLAKGTCTACAVGNICAAAMGAKVVPYAHSKNLFAAIKEGKEVNNYSWNCLFFTDPTGKQRIAEEPEEYPFAVKIIESTGYTIQELARVEKAFETHTKIDSLYYYLTYTKAEIMEDQYNGLMAVVNTLCEIEGIEDPTEYRQLFEYADRI